jgi:nucleotide-binding universal stress UspA family protein
MYERILVLLDGSGQSEEVLPLVRILAEVSKAEIVLLRVAEYPYALYSVCYEYPPSDPGLAKTIQDKKRVIYHEVKDYLERIASALAIAGIKVSTEVCEGPVVKTILASTERLHVDLIALSTCGQGGGTQWVMGAIADRVLHESQVPVILIRPTSRPSGVTPFTLERIVSAGSKRSGISQKRETGIWNRRLRRCVNKLEEKLTPILSPIP